MALFTLLLSTLVLAASSSSSPSDLTTLIYKGCANQFFPNPTDPYTQTLNSLFQTLISQSSSTNFYSTTAGDSPYAITALFQCRGDLSTADCKSCVEKLPDAVRRACGGTVAARAQLGGCYLRYEVAGFQQADETELLYRNCGSTQASGAGFEMLLSNALGEVVKGVGGGGNGFYAGGFQGVYVLGQCEGSLKGGECVNCVKSAVEKAQSLCGSAISGHVYLQSCYVTYTYYPNGVPSPEGVKIETGHRTNTQRTVAIVVGGIAGVGLLVAFMLVLKSAFKKKTKDKFQGY